MVESQVQLPELQVPDAWVASLLMVPVQRAPEELKLMLLPETLPEKVPESQAMVKEQPL